MIPEPSKPRRKLVVGNWKMHTTRASAVQLAGAIVRGLGAADRHLTVVLCPPFPFLPYVSEIVRGTPVALGAQDCWYEREGAFTGEVSPWMLADVGCKYVLVGHSERRHKRGEDHLLVRRKLQAALAAGLTAIFCVGETLEEREAGRTESVLQEQLSTGLLGLPPELAGRLVLAYEPVWAIGTGRHATPEQAQQAHAFLRQRLAELLSPTIAANLRIQYGGSVSPDNAAALTAQPDVDGLLVGGASLVAKKFLAIIRAAAGGKTSPSPTPEPSP
jgi:triosephosphate isomerase